MPDCGHWELLINEAAGIETLHSLGMGIFKHAVCSSSDEEWIDMLEGIAEDCHDYTNVWTNPR